MKTITHEELAEIYGGFEPLTVPETLLYRDPVTDNLLRELQRQQMLGNSGINAYLNELKKLGMLQCNN